MKILNRLILLLSLVAVAFAQSTTPTVQQVFGSSPFQTDVTITIPGMPPVSLDSQYFATKSTAQVVANMVAGKVVEQPVEPASVAGSVVVSAPYEMVQLPNGVTMNAGLVANFFSHGYSADFVATMIRNEIVNQAALLGVAVNASTVTVNIPTATPAPLPIPGGVGAFATPIPLGDSSGAAFNMVTNNSSLSAQLNGETNVQAGIASPNGKVYVGSVLCYNGLFGFTCLGRWSLAQ